MSQKPIDIDSIRLHRIVGHPACIENNHTRGKHRHIFKDVTGEEDRSVTNVPEQTHHRGALVRVESRTRFIEKEDVRVRSQGLCQPYAPHHSARQTAHTVIRLPTELHRF